MENDHDHLAELLRGWNGLPRPAGNLAEPVWQRIHTHASRFSWAQRVAGFLGELDLRFARPQATAALVVIALLLGLGLAELRARYDGARVDAEMSARYIAMLEPVSR